MHQGPSGVLFLSEVAGRKLEIKWINFVPLQVYSLCRYKFSSTVFNMD
jgi:hypothetical protein